MKTTPVPSPHHLNLRSIDPYTWLYTLSVDWDTPDNLNILWVRRMHSHSCIHFLSVMVSVITFATQATDPWVKNKLQYFCMFECEMRCGNFRTVKYVKYCSIQSGTFLLTIGFFISYMLFSYPLSLLCT